MDAAEAVNAPATVEHGGTVWKVRRLDYNGRGALTMWARRRALENCDKIPGLSARELEQARADAIRRVCDGYYNHSAPGYRELVKHEEDADDHWLLAHLLTEQPKANAGDAARLWREAGDAVRRAFGALYPNGQTPAAPTSLPGTPAAMPTPPPTSPAGSIGSPSAG